MANGGGGYYYNIQYTGNTMSATTIGTTWDSSMAAPRAMEWNGNVVSMGPPTVAYTPEPLKESPTDWLRRRVEEIRVGVMAEAA